MIKKQKWYEVPPRNFIDKVNQNELLHSNVKSDILELYKRNKNLALGLVDQIEKYVFLLNGEDIVIVINITTEKENNTDTFNIKYIGKSGSVVTLMLT